MVTGSDQTTAAQDEMGRALEVFRGRESEEGIAISYLKRAGISGNAAAAMRRSVSQLAGYAGSESYAAFVYLDDVLTSITDGDTIYLPKFTDEQVTAMVNDGNVIPLAAAIFVVRGITGTHANEVRDFARLDPDVRTQMKRMLSTGATLNVADYESVFNTCAIKARELIGSLDLETQFEEVFNEVRDSSGWRAMRAAAATIRPGGGGQNVSQALVGSGRTPGPSASTCADLAFSCM